MFDINILAVASAGGMGFRGKSGPDKGEAIGGLKGEPFRFSGLIKIGAGLAFVVALSAGCSSKESASVIAPRTARAPLTEAEGRQLFAQVCASCHGVGGKGNGPRSAMLGGVPDFTDPNFQLGHEDVRIKQVIKEGSGRMPGFGMRFGVHEIDALTKVVRSFKP